MEFKTWVAGHLTGGIGNRLFQHAAAAGLAEKWGYPLVFSIPECENTNHGPFENIFNLFPTVPRIQERLPVQRLPEVRNGAYTYFPFPSEPSAPFVSIDGWRQTEKYFPTNGLFPDFEHALSKERCELLQKKYDLETNEKKYSTWFLHVRLGDYKILPHHQIDLNSYYSQAVKHIPKDARIYLFSDELDQFGQFLQGILREMGVEVIPASLPDELETLYVMSLCWGGAIVANSTFSWWGAYFAHKQIPTPSSYKAIYPSSWGKGMPIATDIIPSWGIRINNGE